MTKKKISTNTQHLTPDELAQYGKDMSYKFKVELGNFFIDLNKKDQLDEWMYRAGIIKHPNQLKKREKRRSK